MKKRRYSITQFTEIDEQISGHITIEMPESELKQRLRLVSDELSREFGGDHDEAINILLHGEPEKGE